jgi:uncharacterized iron-regulated membrane protein
MRASFLSRRWHKWLALVIGIQALFWMISGVYMVTINLDYIHGDHIVKNMDKPITMDQFDVVPYSTILARNPDASRIQLVSWLGNPHYRIYSPEGSRLVNGYTGELVSPLDEQAAREVAEYHYALDGQIIGASLLTDKKDAPTEIQTRPLPLWRIDFNDAISTSLYVSPNDGRLVTRRHDFWRMFDFVWMLHIMDYEDRSDMNNNLLRVAAFVGTVLSLTGIWLLFYSFRRKSRKVTGGLGGMS